MTTNDLWIATWNAVSGVFFLAAVFYGNTAFRDMNPARAFAAEERPEFMPESPRSP